MAKNSNRKLLLVSYSTDREVDGETRRVKFKAKSVVDLTDDEIETLTKLEKATGKAHFRDPITEGGGSSSEPTAPEVVDVPDYAGQDVPFEKKTVELLKAYLTFNDVTFDDKADKATLLAAATAHASGDDKDGGL